MTTVIAPVRAARPARVTVAAGLLGLAAVIQVVNAWASAQAAGPVIEVYRRYAGDDISAKHAWIVETNYTAMIWQGIVLAVAFGALAILVGFPLRWGRVVAMIVAGMIAFWNLVGFAVSTGTPLGANANLSTSGALTELSQAVADAAPAWAQEYAFIEGIVSTGLLIAAIVLLRSAPAKAFYAGRPAV